MEADTMRTMAPSARLAAFREIKVNIQGATLLLLARPARRQILDSLRNREILAMLHYLDPDQVSDIMQILPERRRAEVVAKLDESMRDKVEFLLKFNPRSAAGVMSLDYIQVNDSAVFKHVFELVKRHEKRTGKLPAILVIRDGFLLGEIPWRLLVLRKPHEQVKKYVRRIPTIRFDANQDEVIRTFKSHPHNRIVVLDDDFSTIGVIYSDDVLKTMRQSPELYDFAGVREEEDALDDAFVKVRHRYKWLLLNVLASFFVASVVGLFQDSIEAYVMLAVYMPIVAMMGGNAGTQALAVAVRGLALRELDVRQCRKAVFNEITAGGINGIIVGSVVALIAALWNQNPIFGVIIGMSMIINLMVAGLFGSLTPLVMKALGKDPATSATIFITTATDVFGFLVFLGLGTLML